MLNVVKNRIVNGVLLLDKPIGETSHAVVCKVKRLFCAKKVGHTGTLDPLATGMLPICFGEATKFSQYLTNTDKHYYVVAKFGERTDTSDSEGQVVSVRPVNFSASRLHQVINYFKGQIFQVPSMFSALKYRGCPLYKYARRGIRLPRIPRLINIYAIDLIFWNRKNIALEIYCSKGTYIRSIIDDLGEYLGCGAHVITLRRLRVANFFASSMITVSVLQNIVDNESKNLSYRFSNLDRLLLSVDKVVSGMPRVNVSFADANIIRCGQSVEILTELGNCLVCIIENTRRVFVGVGEIINNKQLIPRRLISSSVVL